MWKKIFFCDCNLSSIQLCISVATSWKNKKNRSNIENLGSTHFVLP